MSDTFVLDASAILCLIRGEPGADVVKSALPDSRVSAVNLGEVVAKLSELDMEAALIGRVLDPLQLRVIPFDAEQARESGMLRRTTRAQGLSFGDRACVTLARRLDAVALTTDRAWRSAAQPARVAFVR